MLGQIGKKLERIVINIRHVRKVAIIKIDDHQIIFISIVKLLIPQREKFLDTLNVPAERA